MSAAELSPKALDDLRSIFDLIASAHLDAAEKTAQRLMEACDTLAKFPDLGSPRDEQGPSRLSANACQPSLRER